MRRVVGVCQNDACGRCHGQQLSNIVVSHGCNLRRARSGRARDRQHVAPGVVGQRGLKAVGIGHERHSAARIVTVVGGDLSQRVGYGVKLSALVTGRATVVSKRRYICQVGARTVHREDATVGVVRKCPRPRQSARCTGRRQHIAVGIVSVRRGVLRRRDRQR